MQGGILRRFRLTNKPHMTIHASLSVMYMCTLAMVRTGKRAISYGYHSFKRLSLMSLTCLNLIVPLRNIEIRLDFRRWNHKGLKNSQKMMGSHYMHLKVMNSHRPA